VTDPAGGVERLAEATGAEFPHVARARELTARQVAEVSAALGDVEPVDGIGTCVFGSWARAELSDESDDDWAVLVAGSFSTADDEVAHEVEAAQARLGTDDRAPGTQGLFGGPISVAELAGNIGLDADSNTNLTRRMLLLLESRELHGDARDEAVSTILGRYLNEGVKSFRPPRFLLNDVVRYWRTICVDFEGKAAGSAGTDPKWATRNAKLRTSRKLLFAGGLVPILLCHLVARDDMPGFLARWFDAPPLDRLSSAFLFVGAPDSGARAVAAYDRWLGLISDPEVRSALREVTYATREQSDLFAEIREIGRQFEGALGSLLFSSALGPVTRAYAIF